MWNLQKLKAICDILTEETCKTLVMGLVISHLDYANAILVGLPETDIHKLQWVQNMAAKLIFNKNKYDTVTECFKKLHWLPIKTRIHFKILTLTYKCLNNQAPEYLSNLLTINETNDRQLRPSSQYRRLIVPFVRLQTFAARSFSITAPGLWNSIPSYIKQSSTLSLFKTNLKTFLFKITYFR